MAAIERGEGADDTVVRGWLAKALSAPRGPQWCCDKCQAIHAVWGPICENCGGFDTLSWRQPAAGMGGVDLTPLMMPKPEVPLEEPDVIDVEAIVRHAN
jgi:HemY protein